MGGVGGSSGGIEKNNRGEMIMNINTYEKKKLLVADFVNHTDGKVEFIIVDNYKNTGEELYNGRQEDLAWTAEGVVHKLCDRVVEDFDIAGDKIVLFLEEEK